MGFHVTYYGQLAEITGQSSESWMMGDRVTVGEFRAQVIGKYPGMIGKKFKIAVNRQIFDDLMLISPQAEVALLPPFAGG